MENSQAAVGDLLATRFPSVLKAMTIILWVSHAAGCSVVQCQAVVS
jgi:hypothetical protein